MKSSDTQFSVFALINGESVEIANSLTSEGDACLLAINYFHQNSEKYPVKVIKTHQVYEVTYSCCSKSNFYKAVSRSRKKNLQFFVSCWLDCIM